VTAPSSSAWPSSSDALMGRFRALVAYDGAPFHGWQIQPGVATVEGELTAALARIAGRACKVQGASRTDAGVHALGQVIHFDYEGRLGPAELQKALNAIASPAVRLLHCEAAESGFHARHDARGKLYRYDLWLERVHHPLYRARSLHVPGRLNLSAMRAATAHFLGERDFSALRAAGCDAPSPVVEVHRVEVGGEPPNVAIWVEGAAFLKYMVRALVGTLLDVGRGRRPADSIPALLERGDRGQAGMTVGPEGLHLVWVRYPEHPWSQGAAALTTGARGVQIA
jgi:tRNA pseudouridine38-40 synthase